MMRVFAGFDRLPRFRGGSAVAVGNFDGLHLGHRRILAVLAGLSERGLRSVVLTFFPHPAEALSGRKVALVQTLGQRLDGFREAGVESVVVAALDRRVSGLSGAEFAESVLAGLLAARVVVVGVNFRFGRGRKCGAEDLGALGRRFGFSVRTVPPVVRGGLPVSSSRVRALVARGGMAEASRLLGRPYEIEGLVVPGDSRGRALGFPTANLRTDNEILPSGVYLTLASTGRLWRPSLTNIGTRPTFGGGPPGVETYILDFSADLYGRRLRLRFIEKLRNERRFRTSEALVRQVAGDLARARGAFLDISRRMGHVDGSPGPSRKPRLEEPPHGE